MPREKVIEGAWEGGREWKKWVREEGVRGWRECRFFLDHRIHCFPALAPLFCQTFLVAYLSTACAEKAPFGGAWTHRSDQDGNTESFRDLFQF